MNLETFISTLINIFIGGLVTWLASRCYYIKSVKKMNAQEKLSLKVHTAMARYLDNSEISKDSFIYNDNDNGYVIAVLFNETNRHQSVTLKMNEIDNLIPGSVE